MVYYFFIMDTSKFATKEDLKEEIKGVKKEISAVKADLKSESKSIRGEFLRVEGKVENLQDEVKELRAETREGNQKLDKLQNTLDGFVGRVDDLSVDNEVGTHHTRELELKVEALEKRVKRIESSKVAA